MKTIRKQELIRAGDRLAVAVSGGADSVALLLLMVELRAELGILLSVAHVNHQLRGSESDEDEQFVADLSRQHALELYSQSAPVEPGSGIEAAARTLRYDFFRHLMRENRVSKIATAHTLDDQAETVLLRMLRGTGIRGLSGIHPRLVFDEGEVVRPLLGVGRSELQRFLRQRDQAWREDSSNRNLAFLRNRVRHRLLPLLEEDFGDAAVENLADLAEIARAEEAHWQSGHPEIRVRARGSSDEEKLTVTSLLALPVAAQRRMVRAWLEENAGLSASFRLVEEVRDLAMGPAGKKLELSGGHVVRRTQRDLWLQPASLPTGSCDYEYRLPVPGEVDVPELSIRLEAVVADPHSVPQDEREQLLDLGGLPKGLTVRNWRPGDRYWPAHTREEKKVKELLADRHLTGAEKKLWPVLVAKDMGLVWMRKFPVPTALRPRDGESRVLWIRESKRDQAAAAKC